MPTPQALLLTPPASPSNPGAWLLALLVHGLLALALTWGVNWQQQTPRDVFEAEIWSPTVQAAAPRPPEPEPAFEPTPPPPPAAPAATPPPPAPPAPTPAPAPAAELVTAQRAAQQKAQQAAQKAEAEKRTAQQAADKVAADRKAAEKAAADRKAAEKKAAEQAAAEKKAAEQARQEQARQQAEEKALEEQAQQAREAQMRRIMNQASTPGRANSGSGSAAQASGPSPGYGARVAARIKPNVVFTDPVSGNPRAEVEVSTLADGTISSRRIVKSSGNPAWDDAVLRAIDRTGSLPRDTDGRVPSPLIIGLRPQD